MAAITVRVVPRSSRSGLERRGHEIVVRVHAPPEGGRANEEVRRALAAALGVPPSVLRLRSGARSRVKTFDVDDVEEAELGARLARFVGG